MTYTQTPLLVESTHTNLKNQHATVLVLLDFSQAFDKLWHHGLRYKMQTDGLPTKLVRWFSDFLRNQRLEVLIGKT
jgi:hypothetical protein